MKKKIILLITIIALLYQIPVINVLAEEKREESDVLNVVFVVDHSGSMNSRDGQQIMPGILNTFIDVMQHRNIKIGYVAYNDTIIAQHPLVSPENQQQRRELKEMINDALNQGETDIGLGLNEAYRMLSGVQGRKIIVLISDGETDLTNSHTGRTREDSDRDIKEVTEKCNAEGISVVTVAFATTQEEILKELRSIASKTNGENYAMEQADELIEILGDIFYNNVDYAMYAMENNTYDEESRYENIEVALFDTQNGQSGEAYFIGKRAIQPAITWDGGIERNKLTDFRIEFTDPEGNVITGLPYLEIFQWSAEFRNLRTDEYIEVELLPDGDGLEGTVSLESSGEYLLYLRSDQVIQEVYQIPGASISNTLPGSLSGEMLELLTVSEQKTVHLSDYFTDADGDELSYELTGTPEDMIEVQIQGDVLQITPKGRGKGEIQLLISDGEGSLAGSIPVRVRTIWEAYWQIIFLLVCIIGFAICKLLSRIIRKAAITSPPEEKEECSFTGKLNAYFTLLPEDMEEIPPLNFALYSYRDKKIVLKDLFEEYPELIDALELDNIYLFPAEGRKMIIYHDCDAAVMIGNSIVCRKMQYVVSYGNVIYITSGDGMCELEVHYISMI